MSPEFFARHLQQLGIDIVHGARYPPLPISGPVDPAGLLTPAHKVEHTETARARLGLPAERCVAYGDSISDAALFAALPHTVAVNADPAIEALARAAYRGDDLREAYDHARAWCGSPATSLPPLRARRRRRHDTALRPARRAAPSEGRPRPGIRLRGTGPHPGAAALGDLAAAGEEPLLVAGGRLTRVAGLRLRRRSS